MGQQLRDILTSKSHQAFTLHLYDQMLSNHAILVFFPVVALFYN